MKKLAIVLMAVLTMMLVLLAIGCGGKGEEATPAPTSAPSLITVTFYPDAHPETSSVDGRARQQGGNVTWSTLRDGAGNYAVDTGYPWEALGYYSTDAQSNKYLRLGRGFYYFDTGKGSLPSDAIITLARLRFYGYSKDKRITGSDYRVNVYRISGTTLSNTAIAASDFNKVELNGPVTALCDTPISFENFSLSGYNDFQLNSAGLSYINKYGVTKFVMRDVSYDVGNTSPSWVASAQNEILVYCVDYAGADRLSKIPRLEVTYTTKLTPTPTSTPTSAPTTPFATPTVGNASTTMVTVPGIIGQMSLAAAQALGYDNYTIVSQPATTTPTPTPTQLPHQQQKRVEMLVSSLT